MSSAVPLFSLGAPVANVPALPQGQMTPVTPVPFVASPATHEFSLPSVLVVPGGVGLEEAEMSKEPMMPGQLGGGAPVAPVLVLPKTQPCPYSDVRLRSKGGNNKMLAEFIHGELRFAPSPLPGIDAALAFRDRWGRGARGRRKPHAASRPMRDLQAGCCQHGGYLGVGCDRPEVGEGGEGESGEGGGEGEVRCISWKSSG